MGGAVAAIEAGWIQDEIHESAVRIQRAIEAGDRAVVGVNRYVEDDGAPPELQRIDEAEVAAQVEGLRSLRAARDQNAVQKALAAVTETSRGAGNLLHPMREALRLGATLGEVSDALRSVFGEYRPSR